MPPAAESPPPRATFQILLRGTGAVLAGFAARVALVFATEMLAARHLGPASYGLLSWAVASVGIASMVCGLGTGPTLRRYEPIFQQAGDRAALRGTVRLALGASALGALVGGALLLWGAEWLTLRGLGDRAGLPVFSAFVFALPFWNLSKGCLSLAAAFKRPGIKVAVEDLFAPCGFLAVVLLARAADAGPAAIAAGYVAVHAIAALGAGLAVRLRTPLRDAAGVRPEYRPGEILGFAWPLVFTETLGKSTGLIDVFFLGLLAGAVEVGIYRVASDLAVTMSLTLMCFGFLYLPLASEHYGRGDFAGWEAINTRVARWTMLASFPIFAVLFFRPGAVLRLLYGPEFAPAEPVLRILAVAYFAHAMTGFTGSNLIVAGHTRWQLGSHLAALGARVGVALIAVPALGVVGAGLMTLAGTVVSNGVNLAVCTAKYGLHPFAASYLRALLALLAGALLLDLALAPLALADLPALAAFGAGLAALGGLLVWTEIALDREDRQLLSHALRGAH